MSGPLSSPGRWPLRYCIDDAIVGTAPELHTHLHRRVHCLGTNTNAGCTSFYIGHTAWPYLVRDMHVCVYVFVVHKKVVHDEMRMQAVRLRLAHDA